MPEVLLRDQTVGSDELKLNKELPKLSSGAILHVQKLVNLFFIQLLETTRNISLSSVTGKRSFICKLLKANIYGNFQNIFCEKTH